MTLFMDHYAELVGKYPTTNKEYLPAAINDMGLFTVVPCIQVIPNNTIFRAQTCTTHMAVNILCHKGH